MLQVRDKYKETYEEIEVPEQLLAKTALLMKAEQKKIAETSRFAFLKRPVLLLALVMMVVVGGLFLQQQISSPTQFQAGKTVTDVSLGNGNLHFASGNVIRNPEEVFARDGEYVSGTLADVKAFYGRDIRLGNIPKGFQQLDQRIERYYVEGVLQDVRIVSKYQSGEQEIMIVASKAGVSSFHANSTIEDVELEITYNQAKEEYYAAFQEADVMYQMTTRYMSQEDFVEMLKKIVTN